MGYTSALETCSAEVRRGVEWLKSNVDVGAAGADYATIFRGMTLSDDTVYIGEVDSEDANIFYVLKEFDQELVEKYVERAKDESFWYDAYCCGSLAFWFLAKLGLSDNPSYVQNLSNVKDNQNRDGRISNPGDHCEVLRILVLLEPYSDYTREAVRCLVDNPEDWWGAADIAVGVLALTELDYARYQYEINKRIDILFDYKKEGGGFGSISSTSWTIQAISRIRGSHDSSVQDAVNWLKQQQNDDGSWGRPCITADALLALISAGDGPKISLAEAEWNETLLNQKIERTKPHFVHTAPISNQRMPVKDIHLKIEDMLDSAETEIKILSPYMNLMYEQIIGLAKNNSDLTIHLVTRNLNDTKGKIGRNALDLLKQVTKGEIRVNEILHARMIIVDDKEALISSADLTRDQLIDEFNAGIWVRDEETVKRATEFFDNIWEESKTKK